MKSISEITSEFKNTDIKDMEAFISEYATDERGGVVKLVLNAEKKLQALSKEKERIYALSEFERKYRIPVFGSWTADFDVNDEEKHYLWQDGCRDRGISFIIFSGKDLSVHAELLNGWKPLGKAFTIATRTKMPRSSLGEAIIKKIDGKPATEIYRKYLHVEPNDAFIENIRQFPFIIKRNGEYLSRIPYYCDAAGELYFIGDIHDEDNLCFSSADPDMMFDESVEISRRMADFSPVVMFFFGSGMRKDFIGSEERELLCFQNILPNSQYLRARGQILYRDGAGGVHNTCAVVVGFREGEATCKKEYYAFNVRTFMKKKLIHPLADRNTSFLLAITDDLNDALENAERDYELNDIERDMIKKHMFPLNPAPPKYIETVILCIADKICAFKETVYCR